MNKRFQQLSLILVCIFIFNAPFFALGQSEDYLSTRTNQEIKEINNDILSKKGQIQKIQEQQEKYSALINQKQSEKATLNNQVAILDNRLAKAELDIEIVRTEIDRTQLEIQKTDLEIEDKNKTIDTEKKHISNVLKLINKNDNVSTLEIMLLNDSFANFLSQAKYLEDVSEDVKTSLDKLNDLKKELLDISMILIIHLEIFLNIRLLILGRDKERCSRPPHPVMWRALKKELAAVMAISCLFTAMVFLLFMDMYPKFT